MVRKNLKLVFPNKSIDELEKIEKDFYRHFADITIESIKAFGMSENQMRNRYKYENIDLIKYASSFTLSVNAYAIFISKIF